MLDALAAHLSAHGAGGPAGLVVHRGGEPIDASRWNYYFRQARTKASLPNDATFHDLRHLFASALISSGCSVKAVQSALGHKSAAMTLNVYSHLWPGDEDRVRAAMSTMFARASSNR